MVKKAAHDTWQNPFGVHPSSHKWTTQPLRQASMQLGIGVLHSLPAQTEPLSIRCVAFSRRSLGQTYGQNNAVVFCFGPSYCRDEESLHTTPFLSPLHSSQRDSDHWRIQDVEDLSFAMNDPLPSDKTAASQAMSFGRAGGVATWHTRRVTRYMTRKQRLVSFPTMAPTLGCIYVTRVSQKQSQVDSTYVNDYMHTGTRTT